MKRIYKISILISVLGIICAINFALAQGKGYFLELGKNLYIFDNINLTGYLAVLASNQDPLAIIGNKGDVLVGGKFILDVNNDLVFCSNDIDPATKLPANKDCSHKFMLWGSSDLQVLDPNFYQLKTNKILFTTALHLVANQDIKTLSALRINGCVANVKNPDGTMSCENGEIKSDKLFLNNLAGLTADNNNKHNITLGTNSPNVNFTEISLGEEYAADPIYHPDIRFLANQYICWRANASFANRTCSSYFNANGGRSFFTNTVFLDKYGHKHGFDGPCPNGVYAGGICGDTPMQLCCFLKINF